MWRYFFNDFSCDVHLKIKMYTSFYSDLVILLPNAKFFAIKDIVSALVGCKTLKTNLTEANSTH